MLIHQSIALRITSYLQIISIYIYAHSLKVILEDAVDYYYNYYAAGFYEKINFNG